MKVGISESSAVFRDRTPKPYDGIGYYTRQLIDSMREQGKDMLPCYFSSVSEPLTTLFPQRDVTLQPCVYYKQLLPFHLHRDLEKTIDVFHCTDFRVPKLKRVPIVASLHDAIMLKHAEYTNLKLRKLKNHVLRKHASYADQVIAVSHAMVEDIVRYWQVPEEKINVVYHGVDESWLIKKSDQQKKAVLEKYNIEKNYVFFSGTLQPRKNLERLIRAFRALPKEVLDAHQLIIVGKNGWGSEGVLDAIRAGEREGLIRWLGYIPFDDVKTLCQAASAVAYVSLSEGFGLPILDGFASGTPVITSSVSSMPEIAGGGAYLVDPENIDNIRQALLDVLTDATLQSRLVDLGNKRVRDFSWKKCVEQTYKVYEKVV